jgi:hypothetical protein
MDGIVNLAPGGCSLVRPNTLPSVKAGLGTDDWVAETGIDCRQARKRQSAQGQPTWHHVDHLMMMLIASNAPADTT